MASPEAFTCPLSLDETGQFDWTLLAKSTGLLETLSLESLTRFVSLSLKSLTPLTPDFDLLGVTSTDCATDLPDPQPERTPKETWTNPVTTRSAVELQCGGG